MILMNPLLNNGFSYISNDSQYDSFARRGKATRQAARAVRQENKAAGIKPSKRKLFSRKPLTGIPPQRKPLFWRALVRGNNITSMAGTTAVRVTNPVADEPVNEGAEPLEMPVSDPIQTTPDLTEGGGTSPGEGAPVPDESTGEDGYDEADTKAVTKKTTKESKGLSSPYIGLAFVVLTGVIAISAAVLAGRAEKRIRASLQDFKSLH